MSRNKISISVDKKIDEILETRKINKSKLINFLIGEFFKNNKNIEEFKKK